MNKTNAHKTETITLQVTPDDANRLHRAAMFSGISLDEYIYGSIFVSVCEEETWMDAENLKRMYKTKKPHRNVEFEFEDSPGLPVAPDWRKN